jgi:hypothetical protein
MRSHIVSKITVIRNKLPNNNQMQIILNAKVTAQFREFPFLYLMLFYIVNET